ncbi:MAG TPA: ATP-binding protein [Thermoanaerobaculia bacterium]|jgi:signal transduction histidine kinase|nr:ATP-binding protein [Thermoanaerobaculia bacterium]
MDANAPIQPSGLGLRTKLTLGFVLLLAILIAVGVQSISLLDDLGGSIDVILRENYRSVIASEQMKETLERMDSGALFALAGEPQQGRAIAEQNRPRFDAALKTELGNITLPGEGERARRLRQLYTSYQPVLERVLDPNVPLEERRSLYFRQLFPTFQQIKGTADEILSLNQQNMVDANDRARKLAKDASREMAFLLLAGTAVAGLGILFLSRAMLGPLERLTRAAGEIEKGHLDLTVPVTSQDELGELAAAFNSMAAGLKELRETDQARLLRARRISQAALDQLAAAVVAISPDRPDRPDRTVELANQAAASQLGLRPDEPLPEPHRAWLLPLLDGIEAGRPPKKGAEAVIRLSLDGRERFFLPHGTVLSSSGQGSPDALVLVLEDVTDRLRGGEVHAGLLANTAHDVEKALDPLRSALDALDEERLGPLTPHQKQRLAGARAGAERIGEIAASLQAMAGLEESRQQLHLEPIQPGELVAAAVREIAPRFEEQQVKLTAEVDPQAPRVLADPERVTLLLPALLRNARAHTPAGGAVTVRVEPWEGRARFTVTDTGRGVPAAYREAIFEPLYQVPGTQDQGSVGLGLAVARNIVQAHGGEIHCESQEGRGATFWFTLPAVTG